MSVGWYAREGEEGEVRHTPEGMVMNSDRLPSVLSVRVTDTSVAKAVTKKGRRVKRVERGNCMIGC